MINEAKFNKWFNAFILTGMMVTVGFITAFKFSDPSISRFMLVLAAVGAIMGVISTVTAANGIIWTFVFGLIDVCIYSFNLMQQQPVPISTLLLHVCYFIPMEFIGFFQWRKHGANAHNQVKTRRLDAKGWFLTVLLFLAVFAASFGISWFFTLKSGAEGDIWKFILDALMTTTNIVALVLMAMVYMEQWYLWTLVNISSIVFWAVTIAGNPVDGGSVVYLVKYIFYLINGLNGIRIWLKLSKDSKVCNS